MSALLADEYWDPFSLLIFCSSLPLFSLHPPPTCPIQSRVLTPSKARQGRTRCGHGQASQKSTSGRACSTGARLFSDNNLTFMIHCHDGECPLWLFACVPLTFLGQNVFLGAVLGASWLCKLPAWRRVGGFLSVKWALECSLLIVLFYLHILLS